MKIIIQIISIVVLAGCASAPSSRIVNKQILSGAESSMSANKLEDTLTTGINNVSAGYSAEATLITDSLITAQESERGKKNLDTTESINKKIKTNQELFTKNQTCFSVNIHTYSLEAAKFSNWVAKVKIGDKILEYQFANTKGVYSVPSTYSDMNGRNWHNSSYLCGQKLSLGENITLVLIPQFRSDLKGEEKAELKWNVEK